MASIYLLLCPTTATICNRSSCLLFFVSARSWTLEQDNAKAQDVLGLFLKNLKFKDKSLDEALRSMVLKFRLPGEAQQMDRSVTERAIFFIDLRSVLLLLLFC